MNSGTHDDPRPVEEVAREVLERLDGAAPDTGDDRIQVDLDDVLEALSARLAAIAGDAR